MRVCLISREYPPETGFGGIATFVRHLAHGLKELGHEVEVVSLAKEQERRVEDDGVIVHRVLPFKIDGELDKVNRCMPYSRYVMLTTIALWRKFYQLHRERPFDVADSPELLAESLYASVLRVVPLVIRLYTPHSKFMAENLHNTAATFDHMFVAMLERLAMTSADVLTSPSVDLAEFVSADLNYPISNIHIIQNPIDPVEFSPSGPRAIGENGKKNVLFVGRLEERKGIQFLIDAVPEVMRQCPDAHFVVIGDDTVNASGGQRSVLADLRTALHRSDCLRHVTFIPRIPLTELPAYYRSADVSVIPSLYDNSPYTCLEAMACGRAVVGTSGGGTPEYVGDAGIIVPPRDSSALAQSIVKLLKDANYRQRLGTSARTRVLEKFQRKKIAEETVRLYELAAERFKASRKVLYLRNPDEALPDAAVMLYCFDRMLYNLLYQESWRFRLSYWWHHAAHRPRLLAAKILLAGIRVSLKLVGMKGRSPAVVKWLEQKVSAGKEDPLAVIRASAELPEVVSFSGGK